MKPLCIIFVIVMTIIVLPSAFSSSPDNRHSVVYESIPVTNIYNYETIVNNFNDESLNKATAGAIATAQHQFNYGTFEWQISIAVGWYKSENAISIAGGKRFNDVLYNFSLMANTDDLEIDGGGAAANWTW